MIEHIAGSVYRIESNSRHDLQYTVDLEAKDPNGKIRPSCTCPGWALKNNGAKGWPKGQGTCSHIPKVESYAITAQHRKSAEEQKVEEEFERIRIGASLMKTLEALEGQ